MHSIRNRSKTEVSTARTFHSLGAKSKKLSSPSNKTKMMGENSTQERGTSSKKKKFLRVYSNQKICREESDDAEQSDPDIIRTLRNYLNNSKNMPSSHAKMPRRNLQTEPSQQTFATFFQRSDPPTGVDTPIQQLIDLQDSRLQMPDKETSTQNRKKKLEVIQAKSIKKILAKNRIFSQCYFDKKRQ